MNGTRIRQVNFRKNRISIDVNVFRVFNLDYCKTQSTYRVAIVIDDSSANVQSRREMKQGDSESWRYNSRKTRRCNWILKALALNREGAGGPR